MSRYGFVSIYPAQYSVGYLHVKTRPWTVAAPLEGIHGDCVRARWALLNRQCLCPFIGPQLSHCLDGAALQAHTHARSRARDSRWVASSISAPQLVAQDFLAGPGFCGSRLPAPSGMPALTSVPQVLEIANNWCLFSVVNNADGSRVN